MGNGTVVQERSSFLEQSWPRSGRQGRRKAVTGEAFSTARSSRILETKSRHFASAVDWFSGGCTDIDGCTRLLITENDVGLHEGGYIRLNALPLGNALRVTGGYYDRFFRPVTVCEKSLPLSLLNERTLEEVLTEIHRKLTSRSAASVS